MPWATLAIIVLVVAYVPLRPSVERWLGVDLPSLVSRSSTPDSAPTATADSPPKGSEIGPSATGPEHRLVVVTAPSSSEDWGGLEDIGGGVKQSPAGLQYAPEGAEGHRLEHVLRHGQDQPQRSGRHGVFDGTRDEVLATIDEAYKIAKSGSSRCQSRREGKRTVHEVDMQQRIGYVGGQTGKRLGHPAATHIRLVLEDNRVITAYPY
jgi:hypothetical protein